LLRAAADASATTASLTAVTSTAPTVATVSTAAPEGTSTFEKSGSSLGYQVTYLYFKVLF
jgi:hypothetical protein